MSGKESVMWTVRAGCANGYPSAVHRAHGHNQTLCGIPTMGKPGVRYGVEDITCGHCIKRSSRQSVVNPIGTFSPRLRRRDTVIRQEEITEALARFEAGGGQIEHGPTYADPLRNTVAWGHGGYINPFEVL